MRKIGFFNIGRLGLVRTWQVETNINEIIEKWIPKHMVFWYDMAKPVDVYIPGVTYTNQFTNDGGKIKYDSTINKCTITHTPTTANKNFWQTPCSPSSAVSSFKIRVTGLPQGFSIESGIYSIKITSDGEYDIPEYKNSGTTTRYPGFYLAGDNVNDVDCNIVVEEIPTRQSVPTNEILKSNPYLQDFSGNNRPLKLNNFLFAAMSGVGGYDISSTNILPDRANVTVTDNRVIHITKKLSTTDNMVNIVPSNSNPTHRFKVTGLSDGRQVSLVNRNGGFYTFDNGEHEVTLTYPEGTTSLYNAIGVTGDAGDMDVTIEFIPKYPNALVTDGVDDYGQVQNFKSLQNYMMFFQCAIIRPATLKGMFSTTPIDGNIKGWMLLQGNSANEVRFGNNVYKNFNVTSSIGDKISYVLSANNELMTCYVGEEKATIAGTYKQTGANMSLFLSDNNNKTRFGSMAFYKSILFDSVPTKENDGFTEQDLIDYYIPKAIVTITVVDVSGSPIQDATVTVGGVQYKTLSDGTVKVRGMANGTMSLSVKKDGYMPFSDNSWKLADSRITLEVLRNTVITENGYSILLEHDGLILTE